jgi:hypothetical protein
MSGSVAALFQRLTQGVYVVGVAQGNARNAFTAAWVMQVSFDPLLLALSINPRHSSYRLLKEGRAFSINVLKKGQLDLAEHYGRPARADKLAGLEWTTDRLGLPLRCGGADLCRGTCSGPPRARPSKLRNLASEERNDCRVEALAYKRCRENAERIRQTRRRDWDGDKRTA